MVTRKQFLYFLYFGTIVLGMQWGLEYFEYSDYIVESLPTGEEVRTTPSTFICLSSSVFMFHLSDTIWRSCKFGELEVPPKIQWIIAWFSLVSVIMLSTEFYSARF